MRMQIRQATAADAALIAAISRETFFDSFADQNTEADMQLFLDEQFTTDMLMAEVDEPSHTFFIISVDGEVAGYAKLKDNAHPQLPDHTNAIEISRFYARKKMIGRGIGKAMMMHVIQYAKSLGKNTIWLGVWEHNAKAIAFYTSFGFTKFSEHDFLLGTDLQRDWLMYKTLD